ncbi:MAG: hypothetical protein ACFBSE_12310 [Prochloraceae cyanobacterium]
MKNNKLSSLKQEAANENTSPKRLKKLADENNILAKIFAENVATPAEILRKLSDSKNNTIGKDVTINPNTPKDILFNLGAKFPEQLLSNPVFDLLLLENHNLLSDLPRNTLKKLLYLPEVPKYFLKWVSQRSDLELLRIILNNPNTPRNILERLLEHENYEIKQMAKLHVNYMGEIKESWDKIAFEEIEKIDRFIITSGIAVILLLLLSTSIGSKIALWGSQ